MPGLPGPLPGLLPQARAGRPAAWQGAGPPGRLPIYQEEASLARALGRAPVEDTAQDFGVLAALGGPETQRNHVATVYADGNAIGALFDRVAGHGDPRPEAADLRRGVAGDPGRAAGGDPRGPRWRTRASPCR